MRPWGTASQRGAALPGLTSEQSERGGKATPPRAPEASGDNTGLLVCSPLRLEARAVRSGIGGAAEVRATGYGQSRSRRQAAALRGEAFGMLAVAGTGGGLTDDLNPGD